MHRDQTATEKELEQRLREEQDAHGWTRRRVKSLAVQRLAFALLLATTATASLVLTAGATDVERVADMERQRGDYWHDQADKANSVALEAAKGWRHALDDLDGCIEALDWCVMPPSEKPRRTLLDP